MHHRKNEISDDFYFDDPDFVEVPRTKISFSNKVYGISILIGSLVFGNTLAANISFNSGGNVEFGQGVAMLSACDNSITLTPYSSFSNTSGGGNYYFSGFRLSDINTSSCNGATFTLRAYDSSTATPLTLFNSNTSASIIHSGTSFEVASGQSALSITETATVGAFKANFSPAFALSSNVSKLTIESTNSSGVTLTSSVTVSQYSFTTFAVGGNVTCAVSSGETYCWGNNSIGQLGTGNVGSNYSYPVKLPNLSSISQVALDDGNGGCALTSSGNVWCWGDGGNGRVGDGTGTTRTTPVQISLGGTATSISAGGGIACARLSDATAKCWGYNYWGGIGNGTDQSNGTSSVLSPSTVSTLTGISKLDVGGGGACAVLTGGSVYCWGYAILGQIGDGVFRKPVYCWTGTTPNCSVRTPTQVSGITNATEIAVGGQHACARLSDSTVKCWGANSYGQIGVANSGPETCWWSPVSCSNTPVSVSGISNASTISAGGDATCVLTTADSVYCWGRYENGVLGPSVNSNSHTPVGITGLGTITKVDVNNGTACAQNSSGLLKCWGSNSYGQFGNGNTTSSSTPS